MKVLMPKVVNKPMYVVYSGRTRYLEYQEFQRVLLRAIAEAWSNREGEEGEALKKAG